MAVRVSVAEQRADIVLDRPEVLNALDFEGFDALHEAAAEVAARDDVRVVVVSGAGRSFCSGIDTTSFGTLSGSPEEMIERAQAGYRAIASLEVPTVAVVQGHALGAGMQVALSCDLRIVARDAQLGLLEVNYGLVPDLGATQRLPLLAGPSAAKRMMWLGERIDGGRAEALGIADIAVDGQDLRRTADDVARRLAAAPPVVVAAVKRLVDRGLGKSFEDALDDVAAVQAQILRSEDFAEAISSFVEKRTPVFTGR